MKTHSQQSTELQQSAAALRGYVAAQLLPSCMLMKPPTGRPDEMDFASVDTSDCVVTVGLRECGLIIDKDLRSAEWQQK